MREGWIRLECVDCEKQWDAAPADLPSPGNQYTCEHCGAQRPVSEFARTQRSLDILEEFHRPA